MYIQLLYQVLLFDENANGNKTVTPGVPGVNNGLQHGIKKQTMTFKAMMKTPA